MSTTFKNNILIILMLLIAFCHSSFCQVSGARKKVRQADEYYDRLDYLKAFNLYKEVVDHDVTDLQSAYRAGQCLFGLNKLDSLALSYFMRTSSKFVEAHYYIGRIFHVNNNLYDALDEFLFLKTKHVEDDEIKMEEIERWIGICKRSIEQSLNKQNVTITNLGPSINSKYPDYAPILSNDESLLVFTSRREGSTGGEKDPYGNFFEDIYYATKVDSINWSKAVPFGNKINTNTHDATVAFTPDSNALLIYRTDAKQTGGDLYISRIKRDQWQEPVILSKKINSDFLESSACFSADGNVIVFSSNRPGGMGGKDLYKIRKFSDDLYSLPQNLGPAINTADDEDAPFLQLDGKTLYFSSNGRNTIGGYDIFKAEYNETNGKCGVPENMGSPINSPGDDIFFVLKKDGASGYLSSNRTGGLGSTDIYKVGMDKPHQVFMVINGRIMFNTKQPIDLKKIQITLIESSGKMNGVYKLKNHYNTFILVVDKSLDYKIIVESPEIEPIIKVINFENDEIELTVKKKSN